MDSIEFNKYFIDVCKNNNIELNNDMDLVLFYKYMNNILKWNEVINLTAIKEPKEFIVKHYADSLTVVSCFNDLSKKDRIKVIDIGTGAGFPGIPLKLAIKNLDITLIDSVNKKLNCIRDSIKEFGLKDVEIIHTRAEDLAKNKKYAEHYDVVVTRAVSNFNNIINYMLPFLKKDGIAVCMKGPNYKEELVGSDKVLKRYNAHIERIDEFTIEGNERYNIIIKK